MTVTNNKILELRGIQRAATLMQWQGRQDCFAYPVKDYKTGETIATRFKSYPDTNKPKYFWQKPKPQDKKAELYLHAPFFGLACKNCEIPFAYLVNGEPALLSMYESGIFNAFCTTLGEGAIAQETMQMLRYFNIQYVIHILDKDSQGQKDGVAWQAYFKDTDIDYKALRLPQKMSEGSDVNDLWIACQFDKNTFKRALRGLKTALLEVPKPQQQNLDFLSPVSRKAPVEIDVEFDANIVGKILSQLGVNPSRANAAGFVDIQCPFTENHRHGDKMPSAGVSVDTGIINCMVCGKHYTNEVAEKLGIENQYTVHKKQAEIMTKAEILAMINSLLAQGFAEITNNLEVRSNDKHPMRLALARLIKLLTVVKREGAKSEYQNELKQLANLINHK